MPEDPNGPFDTASLSTISWDRSWPAPAEEDDRRCMVAYMEERFGIPSRVFEGYVWFRRKNTFRILDASSHLEGAARLKVEAVGMKAFHYIGGYIKPSTRIAQVFGSYATRCRIDLGPDDLDRLVRGEEIQVDPQMGDGYVILILQGEPLGVGLLLKGWLRSQIPKSETRFFRYQAP